MKKLMSIAAIVVFMAGSTAFACDTCGCKAKAAEKAACTACTEEKKCEACTKKCADSAQCAAKKAEDAK